MKKKIFALFALAVLCLCFSANAFASSSVLTDGAGLLTDDEYNDLLPKLEEIEREHGICVAVYTTERIDGYTIERYAEYLYDDLGCGEDGVLMLISLDVDGRGVRIFSQGLGNDVLYGHSQEIGDEVASCCTDGDYAEGIERFVNGVVKRIDVYENGEPFGVLKNVLIALAVGFVAALIITSIMRGKLKSVRPQNAAEQYVVAGSMKVTDSRELFLYKNVVRTHIPKSNPPSGGGRSGGRSGGTTSRF